MMIYQWNDLLLVGSQLRGGTLQCNLKKNVNSRLMLLSSLGPSAKTRAPKNEKFRQINLTN